MIDKDHPSYAIFAHKAKTNPAFARFFKPTEYPAAKPLVSEERKVTTKIIKRSCKRGCWRWAVLVDGTTWESGDTKSEAEAIRLANAEADAIRADLGQPKTEGIGIDKAGIGDALLFAAVGFGLGADTPLRVPAKQQEWVRLLSPNPVVRHSDAVVRDASIELTSYMGRDRWPRWEAWAEKLGTTATLPPVKSLPPDAVEWAIRYAGRVVLVPFSAKDDRTWPMAKWIELERLLLGHGFRCVVLDDHPDRTDGFQSPKLISESPGRVVAAIDVAACVIGNDSGMAHVAGWRRRPTVAIGSKASDVRIMGLYPTVQELGGRLIGNEGVDPGDVLAATLSQVRASLGDFPAAEFAEILTPGDRWRLEAWLPVYATLWRVVRELNPSRIVEIGTRAGYSAWTMLRACPEAMVHGFDLDCDRHGGFVGAHRHARTILDPTRFELTITDSHTIDQLPPCNVAYIDGDHEEQGALLDLQLAERSGVKTILLDDVTNLPEVKRAGDRFCAERSLQPRYVPSATGLYVIDLTATAL